MQPFRIIFLYSFLLALICANSALRAQCNLEEYRIIVELAKDDLNNKIYQRAINRFLDARDVCEDRKEEIDDLISEAFQMIENDKIKAEVASKRARDLLRYAQYSNRLTELSEVNDIAFIQDLIESSRYLVEQTFSEDDIRRQLALDVLTYNQASYLLRISALDQCIALTDSLLHRNPNHSAALELKMVATVRAGRLAKGRPLVEQLAQLRGDGSVQDLNYAFVRACQGEIQSAREMLKRIIDPQNKQLDLAEPVYVREISPDIQKAVGSTSLTMLEKDTRASWQLYLDALDAIEGKAEFFKKYDIATIDSINFATVLYAIHLVDFHLTVSPKDIGAYIALAYLWEASGFPQIALQKINAFDEAHTNQQQDRYQAFRKLFFRRYKRNFSGMGTERLAMLKLERKALDLFTESQRMTKRNELDSAILMLEKACEMEPSNLYFKRNLADAYGVANRNEEAAQLYQDLIKEVPDEASLYSNVQIYLERQGLDEAKIDELEATAEKLDSLDAMTLADDFVEARSRLDLEDAGKQAARFLNHYPQMDIIEYLGDIVTGQRLLETDIKNLTPADAEQVVDLDLLWGIADSLKTANKAPEALLAYEELLKRYPQIWKYRKFTLSRLYEKTGQRTKLRPEQFMTCDQEEQHYIAQYFYVLGERDFASKILSQTPLYTDGSSEQYHQAILLANLDSSRFRKNYVDVSAEELKKHIKGFVAIESNDSTEFNMILDDAYRLGMETAEHFIQYHDSENNRKILVGTYVQMSLKYLNAKRYSASEEIIEKGLTLDPQNAFLLAQQPFVLLFIGKGKEAKELIKSSLVTEEQIRTCLDLGNQIKAKFKYPPGMEKEVDKLIKMLSKK